MQNPVLKDKYIACPFQIQMCDMQGGFSLGTAFFYECEGETFIITNWHNVTGKHPQTGAALDAMRSPSYIRAKWPVVDDSVPKVEGAKQFYFQAQKIEIEDESGPLWFEHPELGSVCDVVAIPVHKPTDWPSFIHVAANKIDETSVPIEPGLKVIVIGFPQGMSTGPGLPVMKTGFLSSMPGYDVRLGGKFSDIGGMKDGVQVPAMLLDVHTIPGMSGSPVFGEYTGFWNPDDLSTSEVTGSSMLGTSRIFLGCYSSRVAELEERSGLALCHQRDAIERICRTKYRGQRFPRSGSGFSYE
jgi:hypothetical protein